MPADRPPPHEIPLAARIVSACDTFNAMTTTRSHRKALPVSAAIAELKAHAGTQFGPEVVRAIISVVGRPVVTSSRS